MNEQWTAQWCGCSDEYSSAKLETSISPLLEPFSSLCHSRASVRFSSEPFFVCPCSSDAGATCSSESGSSWFISNELLVWQAGLRLRLANLPAAPALDAAHLFGSAVSKVWKVWKVCVVAETTNVCSLKCAACSNPWVSRLWNFLIVFQSGIWIRNLISDGWWKWVKPRGWMYPESKRINECVQSLSRE